MAVLLRLAAAGGEVVTREELFEAVWPGVIVTDDALTQCVVELRKAFGDSPRDPQIIKTIPKVGFCLVPPVTELDEKHVVRIGRLKYFVIGALFAVLVLMALQFLRPIDQDPVAGGKLSIAVLPFENRSVESVDDFFVEGLHDDVLSHVSNIHSLDSISRTTVIRYKGSGKTMSQIAEELGVSIVIEGCVRREGESVRINIQLIDVPSDTHLWSEIYDRELSEDNILNIQGEIAEAVAQVVQTRLLLPAEPPPRPAPPTY